ncbi:MAG: CAP domain-containing protein [Cyanobacterium sp. T60_A2020_053]|nr:CAP domain-containing protein [Cyanobacterium sp. T60_A2020_053]
MRKHPNNGLPPLLFDPLITKTAQLHAEDMARRNYFNHNTPEGLSPSDRYINLGGVRGVAENISFQKSSQSRLTYSIVEVFQRGLMYSDGHRKNLLDPNYTKFGYGIAVDFSRTKIYAVQNFQ